MSRTTFSGPVYSGSNKNGTANKMVLSSSVTLAFSDEDTAITVGKLPANSQILEIYVDVTTAFDSGTTNTIDVGTSADDDLYAAGLAAGAVARVLATSDVSQITELQDVGTSDVTVTATYKGTGTAATAGAARVTVVYIQN